MEEPVESWPKLSFFYQNYLPPLAIASLLAWVGFVWRYKWYPPVGTYIAIVAVAGVIITIWPLRSQWSKAAWLGVFLFLGVFEIQNLYRDRDEHDAREHAARKEEREAFNAIVASLKTTLETAKNGFDTTTKRMENLAFLSDENIKMVTGGNSFCYLTIMADNVPVLVHVGKYPLYGVEARISDLVKRRHLSQQGQQFNPFREDLIVRPGDMAVGKAWVNTGISIPFSDPQKQDFNVFIGAKNGSWTEILRMRNINGTWEQAMRVQVEVRPQDMKGKITYRTVCEEVSKNFPLKDLAADSDWTNARRTTHSCRLGS